MLQTELETTGIRLIRLREKLGKTQRDFADGLTSQPHLSEMERDIKPLSKKTIENIGSRYPEVNINWLLSGKGEMFLEKIGEPVAVERGVEETAVVKVQPLRDLEVMLEEILAGQLRMEKLVAEQSAKITEQAQRIAELEGRQSGGKDGMD